MLFQNTAALKTFIPAIHRHTPWEEVEPVLRAAAETYLAPFTGMALIEAAAQNFPAPAGRADLDALRPYLQKCIAWYAYYDMLTANAVHLSPMGVQESRSPDGISSPADGWARNDARNKAGATADLALESLLRYLEEQVLQNAALFPEWQQSTAYSEVFELLIWDSAQLARHVPQLRNGRRMLYMLRSYMLWAQENYLAPALGEYYATLIDAIADRPANPLTRQQEDLLQKIRPWLAMRTMLDAVPVHRVELGEGGIRIPTYDGPSAFHSKRDAGDSPVRHLLAAFQMKADAAWTALIAFLDAHAEDYEGYTPSAWTSGSSEVKSPYIYDPGDAGNSIAL